MIVCLFVSIPRKPRRTSHHAADAGKLLLEAFQSLGSPVGLPTLWRDFGVEAERILFQSLGSPTGLPTTDLKDVFAVSIPRKPRRTSHAANSSSVMPPSMFQSLGSPVGLPTPWKLTSVSSLASFQSLGSPVGLPTAYSVLYGVYCLLFQSLGSPVGLPTRLASIHSSSGKGVSIPRKPRRASHFPLAACRRLLRFVSIPRKPRRTSH